MLKLQKKLSFSKKVQKFQVFGKKITKVSMFLESFAKISSFWKKLQKSQDFGVFFVNGDLIEENIYSSGEFRVNLKLYFNWHHVETLIQTFE